MSTFIASPTPGDAPLTDPIAAAGGMTTRYTNDEWKNIIAKAERGVKGVLKNDQSRAYPVPEIGSEDFTRTIDHTLLNLDAKGVQFDELCGEARVNRFATVCVRPNWVKKCVADLKGSDVRVASVVGFHEGTYDLAQKLGEAKVSLGDGAEELDVVVNWRELIREGVDYGLIYNELASLRAAAPPPVLLKLILETSQLSDSQIMAGCTLAAAASFDFVKTATGFHGHGATVEHVRLMKACCEYLGSQEGLALVGGNGRGNEMKVKASGGIRTLDDAVKMLEAGASRLGTSGGVWIAKEAKERVENLKSGDAGAKGERPGLTTRLWTDY